MALDLWRHSENCREGDGADAHPLALIAETAHGPRIEAVNRAGHNAGVRAGSMLADARAVYAALKVYPSDPAGDAAFLERLALWAQRWGPWSAIDPPDGLLVDVTAVAHLFGGEAALLADAQAMLAGRGLATRLAIAPTCGAAWALAHYGRERAVLSSSLRGGEADEAIQGGSVRPWIAAGPSVPRNDEAMMEALSSLPVAALRLEPEVLLVLRRLGLKRIGQIATIDRDALKRRFRARRRPTIDPLLRLDQLLGRAPEPLLPVIARPMPLVQRRLMEPIRHRPLLEQVMADLAADMARKLEGLGEGARRLELGMWRVDGEVVVRSLEMAAAARDPAHVCRLFAARLDDVDAGFGIELVRLRATWTEALALAQSDIETAAETEGTTLAQCLDRLTVRLGDGAVRRPVPFASHIPERAQRWQPPLAPEPPSQGKLAFHARPLKMLDRPELIVVTYPTPNGYPRQFRWRGQVHDVVRVEGPERIAPEWWREKGSTRLRDYYRVEDSKGRRYWIYRRGVIGDGRGGLPDWFLQGLCA
jgi:protein ImuB